MGARSEFALPHRDPAREPERMATHIHSITVDCHDPAALCRFWRDVLGYVEHPAYPNADGDTEWLIVDPNRRGPDLLFIVVPEAKATKNRIHLDLQPVEVTRDVDVERVLALGATQVDDRRNDDGTGWVVLADPEGNEFCIVRSAAERGEEPEQIPRWRPMPEVRAGTERELTVALLDWYRDGVFTKVASCSDFEAHARPGPSETSIAGIVRHLALVEDSWFTERFAGGEAIALFRDVDWKADPDFEFRTARDEPLAASLDLYRAAIERSNAVIAAHELDDRSEDSRGPLTLRWCITHMMEETARHLGHIDLLREIISGTTGG